MLFSTTHLVDGYNIAEYKGVVNGESVFGASVISDSFASIANFFGQRSKSYEKVLREARAAAAEQMKGHAASLGANAIIGITVGMAPVSPKGKGDVMMVVYTGTAVKIERTPATNRDPSQSARFSAS